MSASNPSHTWFHAIEFPIRSLAREQGRLTTQIAEQQTGANRATIRAHLIKLVNEGRLVKCGAGRGTWYVAAGD
jgi:predicted HTH transcriptional regulator